MKGYLYLLKRNGSEIKILCECEISDYTKDPDPYIIIKNKEIASKAHIEIHKNKMYWQSVAEPGSIEQILLNCKNKGISFANDKHHPKIKQMQSSRTVSNSFSFKVQI